LDCFTQREIIAADLTLPFTLQTKADTRTPTKVILIVIVYNNKKHNSNSSTSNNIAIIIITLLVTISKTSAFA